MSLTILPYENLPTETDLQTFETEIGYRLPDDYRQFLLAYNGGQFPEPENLREPGLELCFPGAPVPRALADLDFYAPGNGWDVALFHGLLRPAGNYGDLQQIYRTFVGEIPPELLPIASQMGNAKYFLCLDGERHGEVLFTSHETHRKSYEEEVITQADFVCVARSFSVLFEGLHWRIRPE